MTTAGIGTARRSLVVAASVFAMMLLWAAPVSATTWMQERSGDELNDAYAELDAPPPTSSSSSPALSAPSSSSDLSGFESLLYLVGFWAFIYWLNVRDERKHPRH